MADGVKHGFMSRKGVSAAECLRENCPVPSNATVKDFARWYCKSRCDRLDKWVNDISTKNTLKKFFSGFERVTKTKIPDRLRTDVYIFLREVLIKQEYMTTKTREKSLFTDDDLEYCVVSLWTEPDHVFIHEVMRGQLTILTQAYCYSGARVGAFVHNFTGEVRGQEGKTEKVVFKVLTWKDVHIYLPPLPGGTTEPIIKPTQRWVKNNKDPENNVYFLRLQHSLYYKLERLRELTSGIPGARWLFTSSRSSNSTARDFSSGIHFFKRRPQEAPTSLGIHGHPFQ